MLRHLNFPLACACAAVALAFAAPADSQTVPSTTGMRVIAGTYNLDVSNGSVIVDALITANSAGHATGITGVVNGTDPITGLSTYAGADNNLYMTGAWVTFGGLSFSTRSLGDFNFYNSGSGYYIFPLRGFLIYLKLCKKFIPSTVCYKYLRLTINYSDLQTTFDDSNNCI